ncbi:MAG: hypothetical protein ACOYWZ_04065 [Bacillota bacterium]
MGNDFLLYLIYSVTIIFLLIVIFLFFMLIRRRRYNRSLKKHPVPRIDCGSVSVFFDQKNNVIVIPYVKDKYGVGRAIGKPQFLQAPYNTRALGEVVRRSMAMCKGGHPCTDALLMSKLNSLDWKDFSKDKRNISIYYKEELGLVFNTTKRVSDGSYQFNFRGYEKVLGSSVGNEELGVVLMNLLERCRC